MIPKFIKSFMKQKYLLSNGTTLAKAISITTLNNYQVHFQCFCCSVAKISGYKNFLIHVKGKRHQSHIIKRIPRIKTSSK